MNKVYAVVICILALLAYDRWRHSNSFDQGYNAHKAEVADRKDEADSKDKEKVVTVIEWRDKEKVVYRDKIKYIKQVEDPTGCADTKLIDMGFGL